MKYKSLTYAIAMSVGVLTAPLALADLNDGLVAHYPFDGNAQDASGNGNHGKEYGGVQYADGMIGKSAKFDGDYIRIPQSDSLRGLNELTIAYWVKYYKPVSGSGNVSVTITNGPDSVSGDGFFTYAMSSGIGHYLGRTGNSVATRVPLNAGEPLSQQEFVFAVFSADANTIRSYKNGQMVDEKNRENKSASGRPETDWFVGANGKDSSPYYLNGYIDDLRIYNRALSKDEIQALYYNGTCKHATYSPKKRTLTVPFVEMPVVDFLTGQPTGEMELWTGNLKQVLGTTNRFRLLAKTVAQITDGSSSSCPATYAVETGTLNIPYIDVPTGIVVGNKEFENGVDVFKATMTWEPMGKSFVVQKVEQSP
jgi:hypothetical protein